MKSGNPLIAAVMAVLLSIGMIAGGVVPAASAADGRHDYLQIDKRVDNATPLPGQTFTYTIKVTCSEQDCVNAKLIDTFPAALAGFQVDDVSVTPATTPATISWSDTGSSTPPTKIGAQTTLTAQIDQPGSTSMAAGSTFSVLVSLRVPDDYPVGDSGPIVNEATATADNANPVASDATIDINVAEKIDVDVAKSWKPQTETFAPGKASTISLEVGNASNVAVDTLVIQEPKAAVDGASSLDPSNPATITDFAGFSNVSLPSGCTTAQVDVYVFDGSSWHWRTGPPVTGPAALVLPDGIANSDVGGYRVTCTGDIAPGQKIAFDTSVTQRSTDRNTGADLSTGTHTVDNVATGSTAKGNRTAAKDASASHSVTPVIPTVEAQKSIVSGRITAGQSATGTISATNGAVPVSELHLADLGFFTADVTFGGFTAAPEWPTGATSASVTYHLLDGTTETRPFAKGATPPAPSGPISGFELVYRGDAIAPSTTGGASFTIDTTTDATKGAPQLALSNTVNVDVTAANGQKATDDASAPLTVIDPAIDVTIDKSIRPGSVVPGERVVASLDTQAKALGDDSTVHDIVVTDAWDGSKGAFWDAFRFDSVAPTQVPANTQLTVEVRTADGTWVRLAVAPAQASASIFQLSPADTASALAAIGLSQADVQGVRFSFHNDEGFPSDTTVSPNPVFAAASDLRTGGTTTPGGASTSYPNTATADADGSTSGGKALHDHDEDTTSATVDPVSPIGPGNIDVEKSWDRASVSSQSGDQPHTNLDWRVAEGLNPVTITDAASGFGAPQQTVFDAFDLKSIAGIATSSDPYTNGWYLKYDSVTDVQLYDGGTWHSVANPAGWMGADRSFTGYTLTPQESAETTGVRIVLHETAADTAARTAARASGDPLAPAPGSGVGASERFRTFDLGWQLRDVTRSNGAIISSHSSLNDALAGVVDNTVRGEGTRPNGDVVSDQADAKIAIIDQDPAVGSSKTVDGGGADMFVPVTNTPQDSYPTATWTLTGWNASVSKATSVRLTDPAPCSDTDVAACESEVSAAKADPFDTSATSLTDPAKPNPFERFTLTKLTLGASITAEVDLDASIVWLLHDDGGVFSTTQTTAAAAAQLTPAQLADVVGVSATFDGASAQGTGQITKENRLTITMETQLRATLRSSGAPQVLRAGESVEVTNRLFAQSYDPVINPGTKTGDTSDASKTLVGGDVNIGPSKTITPDTLDQPTGLSTPMTVTLGADQGANPRSTLSPSRVVIEDQSTSTEFWNAVDFTGFGALTLPAGADQVQIDAFTGGAWVTGAPGDAPALPAGVAAGQVQGLRVTFSRADGGLFSANVPADNWSGSLAFTAALRPNDRATGAPVTFDRTITNTQTSQSFRPDGNDSEPKDASAEVSLGAGSHELAVRKLTNGGKRIAAVGDQVPFDLTFTNIGTGFLTLTTLTDALPAQLAYTEPSTTTFTKDADGSLSDKVTVTPAADGRSLAFTWPDGGNVMKPGETFTIRAFLELQPGLTNGAVATNTMTVATEEPLDVCRNTQSGGSTTGAWENDPKTCGTTDTVGAVAGSNLFTVKGVQGSLAGAENPANPALVCAPSLDVDGQRYFRAPCVANSEIDGTDNWVLHNVNAGTVPVTSMTLFDQLPAAGDSFIIAGSSRGSMYRPELVADSLTLNAPAGTTQSIEVTTSTGVCQGTWDQLPAGVPCAQNGESWAAVTGATDWSAVTGIRITLDFTTTAAGALAPGQAADVTYSTVNKIRTADRADGASNVVPAANQVAVNQYGLKFQFAGEASPRKIAPREAAVQLRVGSIAVVKQITGPAAAYAPESFQASVVCTAGGATLDLGADATVTLSKANGYRVELTGIPVSANGTSCTVTELGERGAYGETSRSGSPATVKVDVAAPQDGSAAEIPAEQVVTLTNDYRFTGLSITKKVETSATGASFGPFAFELTCTTATGAPVTFSDAGDLTQAFTLVDGATWTAPADRIPVGSSCRVTESGSSFADHIAIVGDNVVDDGNGSATITPGTEPAHVTVTNGYDAGTLTVAKKVTGTGADRYGAGPFGFTAVCTYHGQTLLDETFTLERDATRTFAPFPAGTSCVVTEQKTGGATDASLDPADGTVTIAAGTGEAPVGSVTVTATNRFDLASFDVVKKREGNLLNPGAAGPFTVTAVCTSVVDGVVTPLDVPGGAERLLSADNAYRTSYTDLPAGASCDVTETSTGHADSTTIAVDDADPVAGTSATVLLSGQSTPQVTVTNTFTAGQIAVTKAVSGTDADAHRHDVFGVTLACTWYGDDIAIPGGAVRDLTVGSTVTYTDLPTSADCVLTESRTGGATQVSVTVDGAAAANPAHVVIGKDTTAQVAIDNRFDSALPVTGGHPAILLVLSGIGAAGLAAGILLLIRRRRRES